MRRQSNACDACHCRQSELTNASFLLWRPGAQSCISPLLIAALVPRLLVSLLLVPRLLVPLLLISGLLVSGLLVRCLLLTYDPGTAVGAENGIIREFAPAKSAEHTVPPLSNLLRRAGLFCRQVYRLFFQYYYNPFDGMTSIASV